jgi:mono/diheme cytochrome c family protein
MLKLLFVLPPLMVLALLPQNAAAPSAQMAAFAQTAAPDQTAPAEPAAAPDQAEAPAGPVPAANPVIPTAESQAHAAATFKIDCSMCHGVNGNGKGDLVADMGLSMKDLRDPATLQSMSDREVYLLIRDGKGKMPSEGQRAKPDDIWNLVILVRGFAKK